MMVEIVCRETSAPQTSQVGLHLAGGQALRGQRDDHLVDAGQALLPLFDDLRLERAIAVAGTIISAGVMDVSARSWAAAPDSTGSGCLCRLAVVPG